MKYIMITVLVIAVFVAGYGISKEYMTNREANLAKAGGVMLAQGFIPPPTDRPPSSSGSTKPSTCPSCVEIQEKIKQKNTELDQLYREYARFKLGLGTRPALTEEKIKEKVKAIEADISTLNKELAACQKQCQEIEVRRALPAKKPTVQGSYAR